MDEKKEEIGRKNDAGDASHVAAANPGKGSFSALSQAQRSVDYLLVERFNAGDIQAFEILVTKYQRRVAWIIDQQVRHAAVAEELTQEVFLRAYRALGNFRFESAFATWLYTIARNAANTYYRDGHVHADNAMSIDAVHENTESACASIPVQTSPSPEEDLSVRQLLAAIEQSIERLSPQMRTSIIMREMEECSYADIADKLHIPLNTVRSLIFRARATIALDIRPLLDRAISTR